MKAVLLMCGLPGSGKSTWIKENKLEPYSISRDNLRLLYYGPLYNKYGLESMPYASEKLVYEEYMRIVEMRMRNNSFIVLDNTHLKVSSINSIVNLAEYYGYKVFIKVMDTSVTECLRRNKGRESIKFVPEEVIIKMNRDYKNILNELNKLPVGLVNGMSKISSYEFNCDRIPYLKSDTIYIVGDIHGCYNELSKFLDDFESSNDKNKILVFTGDYIDRGPENLKVINKLINISEDNSIESYFIEGNHEKSLYQYSYLRELFSKEFIDKTKPQLDKDPDLKLRLRSFLSKLHTHLLFKSEFTSNLVVCHGGISWDKNVFDGNVFMSPESVIKGSDYPNGDMSKIAEDFNNICSSNSIQFHGHRPVFDENGVISHARTNQSVVNLDGHVDQGGHLLVAKVNNGNITILKY